MAAHHVSSALYTDQYARDSARSQEHCSHLRALPSRHRGDSPAPAEAQRRPRIGDRTPEVLSGRPDKGPEPRRLPHRWPPDAAGPQTSYRIVGTLMLREQHRRATVVPSGRRATASTGQRCCCPGDTGRESERPVQIAPTACIRAMPLTTSGDAIGTDPAKLTLNYASPS